MCSTAAEGLRAITWIFCAKRGADGGAGPSRRADEGLKMSGENIGKTRGQKGSLSIFAHVFAQVKGQFYSDNHVQSAI